MIRKGEDWGRGETGEDPGIPLVMGGDAELASALSDRSLTAVRFVPAEASDLARTLGGARAHVSVEIDALRIVVDGRAPVMAVNGLVIGRRPDSLRPWHRSRKVAVALNGGEPQRGRATSVLVMNGQFVGGRRVVVRGHPADGRAEVQVYAVPGAQRAELRRRLAGGNHLPHPAVTQRAVQAVVVEVSGGAPVEIDGRSAGRASRIEVEVVPRRARVVVGTAGVPLP